MSLSGALKTQKNDGRVNFLGGNLISDGNWLQIFVWNPAMYHYTSKGTRESHPSAWDIKAKPLYTDLWVVFFAPVVRSIPLPVHWRGRTDWTVPPAPYAHRCPSTSWGTPMDPPRSSAILPPRLLHLQQSYISCRKFYCLLHLQQSHISCRKFYCLLHLQQSYISCRKLDIFCTVCYTCNIHNDTDHGINSTVCFTCSQCGIKIEQLDLNSKLKFAFKYVLCSEICL